MGLRAFRVTVWLAANTEMPTKLGVYGRKEQAADSHTPPKRVGSNAGSGPLRVPDWDELAGGHVSPQPLQLIKLASRRMEDMDHEIDVVNEDPTSTAHPFY